MAAPSWAIVGTRLSAADALTGWDAGNISSDDLPKQGAGCVGQKISGALGGFGYTHGSTFDLSGADRRCAFLWMNSLSRLDTKANGGKRVRVGNDSSNYREYHVAGADDPYSGGWRKRVVSPRVTPTTTVGTPDLTLVDYFAGFFNVVASIMGNFNNCTVDALDLLEAIRMTDGDVTTPGTFDRFTTFDTGTLANQYGLIRLESGVYFMQGRLYLGDGATASLFDDRSGAQVIFEDNLVDSDFYEIQLTANATLQLGELSSGAPINGASITSAGPAWHLNLAAGTATLYGCTFGQTRISTLSPSVTARDCVFAEGGTITAAGADLKGSAVTNPTVAADASALVWDVATNPDGFLDDMLYQKGAAAHHAIAFGLNSPTSITLRDIDFTGFNASNGQNDSTLHVQRTSGTVTINLVNCTGAISYKSDGATVDLVLDQRTFSFDVEDEAGNPLTGYEWRLYEASATPGVLGTVELAGEETATQASQNYSYTYTADLDVVLQVIHNGYEEAIERRTLVDSDQNVPVTLITEGNI